MWMFLDFSKDLHIVTEKRGIDKILEQVTHLSKD